MDRIQAIELFLAALDEGSLAAAGRRTGKSQAAVSRAIAFLEGLVGTVLLHRSTRALRLSEAGERYAAACRRALAELEQAEAGAAGAHAGRRGTLSVTAPTSLGEEMLAPVLQSYLEAHPEVSLRLQFVDAPGKLVDDGVDVALRIGPLADSALVALRVGEVRRVVVAAPRYLAGRPRIEAPGDLVRHQVIATPQFGLQAWSFPARPGSTPVRPVRFTPRAVVDGPRAAVACAVAGSGVTRVFAHQVQRETREGVLQVLLAQDDAEALPVQLVATQARLSLPKVRAFFDHAAPLLRRAFR